VIGGLKTLQAGGTARGGAWSWRCARRALVRGAALLGLALALAWWAPRAAAGQGDGFINREYPLKALFLYNFGGYVEWPDEAFARDDEPFTIGILGNAPLDTMLREIALTKKIGGRPIVVRQFAAAEAVERCHILFLARDVSHPQQQAVIERLRSLPVLLVGESEGFASRGGCVNFYIESNKIRFEINLEAVKQQQLRISAKLLALAKIVP
jgi:hypothetical protein